MNTTVKTSLENVFKVINGFEDSNLKMIFIEDIYHFISTVFTKNDSEKFDYFCKVYSIDNSSKDFEKNKIEYVPDILKCFCDIDLKRNSNTSDLLISFFAELGKHYLTNKFDRNDFDIKSFTAIFKSMNEYADNHNKSNHKAKKQESNCKAKNIEKNIEISESEQEDTEDEMTETVEPEESLEELLEKLNSLIGLDAVKKEVNQIINLIKLQKKGQEFGETSAPLSLHLVFFGNPGTGKTTVARLLSKIYKSLGVLSNGQLVEVDRGGLVAGYVGQTATKTQEKIDEAMGGILFIDEAYALTHGKGENDFGQEAVDTILKAMEDHRDDFIVIVAGYPDLMKEFIASNPGLKSRFNQFINFEDYKPDELIDIFNYDCTKQGLVLSEDCLSYLSDFFTEIYNNRSDDYANGRDVRNYFENVIKARANRLAPFIDCISREEYFTITLDDLKNAASIKNSI